MADCRCFSGFAWFAVAVALSVACGGTAVSGPTGGDSPAGGASPSGGASPGGAGAGGATSSCAYHGKTYADGEAFPDIDGCNTCSCQFGSVGCTQRACGNNCTVLQDQYAEALKRAKTCDPAAQTVQCESAFPADLGCGCPTPVNASNTEALSELTALGKQGRELCSALCAPTPCIQGPGPATCTAAGTCEPAPLRAAVSCKVSGVVYPSGATGIPDPRDTCNRCACADGGLECTQKACATETPCPPATSFEGQCAQCGPTDACQIVEYTCLPFCSQACMNGFCSNGLCRTVCG